VRTLRSPINARSGFFLSVYSAIHILPTVLSPKRPKKALHQFLTGIYLRPAVGSLRFRFQCERQLYQRNLKISPRQDSYQRLEAKSFYPKTGDTQVIPGSQTVGGMALRERRQTPTRTRKSKRQAADRGQGKPQKTGCPEGPKYGESRKYGGLTGGYAQCRDDSVHGAWPQNP